MAIYVKKEVSYKLVTLTRVGNNFTDNYKEYDGLSTDTKPTESEGAKNGSVFYAMDTGVVYKYDSQNNVWRVV